MDPLPCVSPPSKATAGGHTMPARPSSSRAQEPPRQVPLWRKLDRAVANVERTLKDLAKLGHRDADLYFSWDAYRRAVSERFGEIDSSTLGPHGTPPPVWCTAPDTDDHPSEAITIGDLTCEERSIHTDGILWIGKGPRPNFNDPAFWFGKSKELNQKIWQLKYGLEGPPPGLGKIQNAIFQVSCRLARLAGLGRSGQWILHKEDLYKDRLDTRPGSRNPDEVFPIRGLKYKAVPINDHGIIWAGKGQRLDFENPAYWVSKVKELDAKIQQVEDGHVRPEFTPAELRTLELMERQEGHCFHRNMMDRKNYLQQRKDRVFTALRELALLGRPGQWVLHHEELYDPDIDTRPQLRKPDEEIRIGGLRYKGNPIPNELRWAGEAQPPDFEDLVYWERKADKLVENVQQVKDGKVQDQFTPEEVLVLESMERDEDHFFFFCEAEKQRREKEEQRRDGDEEEITPSSQAAAERLRNARTSVLNQLFAIAEFGLPGMWVLRQQDIYWPEHHIPRPDDETTMAIPPIRNGARLGFADTSYGLRYAGDFPPDFDDIRYWESKLEELRAKKEEVKAGRVEHRFTKLEELQLLESEREFIEAKNSTQKVADRVESWLGRENDPQGQPSGMQTLLDPPTTDAAPTVVIGDSFPATWPSSRSATPTHSGAVSTAAATNVSSGPPNGPRRKRPADEPLPTMRPAKCRRVLRSDAAAAASGMPYPPRGPEDRVERPRTGPVRRKRSFHAPVEFERGRTRQAPRPAQKSTATNITSPSKRPFTTATRFTPSKEGDEDDKKQTCNELRGEPISTEKATPKFPAQAEKERTYSSSAAKELQMRRLRKGRPDRHGEGFVMNCAENNTSIRKHLMQLRPSRELSPPLYSLRLHDSMPKLFAVEVLQKLL
ncbi:hypothetical protein GE09DRAFT_662275 [Coniochaeta sp. 2T2.1]|nr:hypothetical protein GE09DRAFT_662275 [Coniochaeta sp. 2T2.1]